VEQAIMASKSTQRGSGRRAFLGQAGGAAAAAMATRVLGGSVLSVGTPSLASATVLSPTDPRKRIEQAYQVRNRAALNSRALPVPEQFPNGDDSRYPDRLASFTKALPHDSRGHVDGRAYTALLQALKSGSSDDFENIPMGGLLRLADPQAGFAYDLQGADSCQYSLPAAPEFSGEEQAAEMVELYWMALLRDVRFDEYELHPLARMAADELSAMPGYRGPRENGAVTPRLLFRGDTPGDVRGPLVSQFLLKDIPYGTRPIDQRIRTMIAGDDYQILYKNWLAVQNGSVTGGGRPDPTYRYINTGRDLAEWVHVDFTYQGFLNAALILLGMKVPFDTRMPYRNSVSQSGFTEYGAPHLLDMVARVASSALKATWFQKWSVHRRLRPEELGGRVHNHWNRIAEYPVHASLVDSKAVEQSVRRFRTGLLPQAYPEGSPVHPSYPAGHGAIAGACTTVLKAFFHETFVIREPVMPGSQGLSLMPYRGPDLLTVGGELNKLAANIARGRDHAGIHYRTDGMAGIKLGEDVAISVMRDMKECFTSEFRGLSLTRFDGTTVTI
jgi:hypothetical protein